MAEEARAAQAGSVRDVLVVDDSRTHRLLLRSLLGRLGYRVREASDGAEALAMLRAVPSDIVISDWMMPGLTGPELCAAIRTEPSEIARRTYIVLVTAKQDHGDIARGIAAGADDFLTKPVHEVELAARLLAGARIVEMQASLQAEKTVAADALAALQEAQAAIEADLATASLLQAEFVPPRLARCNGAVCAVAYQSAGPVGGDVLGYFPIGRRQIGVYSIDVSGHGIAAALRAVHLSQLLSPRDPAANLALEADGAARDPAEAVADLNARFAEAEAHDLYFTMALATIDLATGQGRLCRAGHPPPARIGTDGRVEFLGLGAAGGPPVGLLPGMGFASERFRLAPGEKLLLASDGLFEAARPDGTMIEAGGIAALLCAHAARPVAEILPGLLASLAAETGRTCFEDDLSALLVERPPAPQGRPQPRSTRSSEAASSASSAATSSGAGSRPAPAAASR